ncbi:MAG: VWA domain-containing protein [Eubacterium sp.]|nr:VWA domain-containing protein [Eubacterium sp.]
MITKPIIPVFVALPVLLIILCLYIAVILKRHTRIRYKILGVLRIVAIIFLVFLINLRIMSKRYNATVEMKNLDVLFVVDTTMSMWAEDYDGSKTRMSGVLKDTEYIIDELSGSNFGLIRFDNYAQVLCPFTQDHETVKDAFSTIKMPDRYYAKGTSLNTAYGEMKGLLESSSTKEERQTILFFISDGEITDNSALKTFKDLEPLVDAGAVLGYGTEKGGKMQAGTFYYIQDSETYKDAVSVIDEGNLKRLADDLQIDYIHMGSTANVKYLVESIKDGSSLTMEKSDSVSYEDTYFLYVIPLVILLGIEMALFIRRGHL